MVDTGDLPVVARPAAVELGRPGRLAVELLIDQFAGRSGKDPEQIRLPTELVLRESSGPASRRP